MFKVNILLACCLLCNYLWRIEFFLSLLPLIVFQLCVNYSLLTLRPQFILTGKYCNPASVICRSDSYCTSQGHDTDTELSYYYSMRGNTDKHTHTLWIREAYLKSCTQEAKEILNSCLLLTEKYTLIKPYMNVNISKPLGCKQTFFHIFFLVIFVYWIG